jgi:hypothetical protein
MTNCFRHHPPSILDQKTRLFGDWGLSPSSGKKDTYSVEPYRASSCLRAQQCKCPLLPADGDRLQSPVSETSRVFDQGYMMDDAQKFVILTIHHRHKPSEFTYYMLQVLWT